MSIKYPNIKVKLIGEDGNAFSILARVDSALKKAKIHKDIRDEFFKEATSKDYNHLLNVVSSWVKTI
ncbi:hypothetical protein CLC19245_00872 [Campylobacter lari subsp. concheus]|nr:hypothetical protein [Campylobacter lari]MCR2070185.1 hypothetical protein [Campylobacter lari subsp. concheus]MCV3469917.1 hypothetical protein [Campylobacter sp. CNRCH_2015_0814]MCV3482173.1 hypothetical protein [Campylobacter sp. CNRCH_2014_0184h]MCV3531202.1 hypothetical protein [Campylobacter sp. CNRCH_2007_0968H]